MAILPSSFLPEDVRLKLLGRGPYEAACDAPRAVFFEEHGNGFDGGGQADEVFFFFVRVPCRPCANQRPPPKPAVVHPAKTPASEGGRYTGHAKAWA